MERHSEARIDPIGCVGQHQVEAWTSSEMSQLRNKKRPLTSMEKRTPSNLRSTPGVQISEFTWILFARGPIWKKAYCFLFMWRRNSPLGRCARLFNYAHQSEP
jgi:hypothetical protein